IIYLLAGLWFMRDALVYALFSALLITLMLSWGQNLMTLTDFFLDHVPGYSKFRAVTIILVIVELVIPVLAMLYLDKLIKSGDWNKIAERRFLIPTAAVLVVLIAFAVAPSSFFNFISDGEQESFGARVASGAVTEAQMHVLADGIKEYRIGVFTADVWRSFAFVLLGALGIFFSKRWKWNSAVLVFLLIAITLVDQFTVDKRYVNNEKDKGRYLTWEDPKDHAFPFDPTAADMAILQGEWNPKAEALHKTTLERMKKERAGERGTDKLVGKNEEVITRFGSLRRSSDYRVLTMANPFNDSRVSYFHKSLGGYHGAKLKRYQELIEFQLAPAMQRLNTGLRGVSTQEQVDSVLKAEGVMNMLNMRYL
ncbi:MAG TPA: hypothetical protein PK760_15395, partial [Flavobacteriales bacterium]|nr:hypothetical protein [Flavobacteriales bacterium]